MDTAGQDEYSIFPTQYSVDIHGYVLVYSIDSQKSFEVVQVLYDKIVDLVGDPKVPVVLVGNKKGTIQEQTTAYINLPCDEKLGVLVSVYFKEAE